MKCVIIAAGKGTRLAAKGDSKPLVPLGGIPLIERVVLTVMNAGIKDFYVVIGHNGQKVRERLTTFAENHPVTFEFIQNDRYEEPNGISVHCASQKVDEPFILLMSDHLFDSEILRKLCTEGIGEDEVKLAVDLKTKDNPLVDIDDVTKVLVKDNSIVDIGKTIPQYNAFDTGIFLCTPKLFEALAQSIQDGDASLSGGIRKMGTLNRAKVFDIGNHLWLDVDDDAAFEKAEKYFIAN